MSTLYVVATPIGNLGDITLRALETLRAVDVVYAEDTRVSRKLLDRYEIAKPLRSFREAASPAQVERMLQEVLAALEKGDVAYVSDAGSPGVSDPGGYLAERVSAAGFTVSPIPGPSALAAILSVAGLPVARPLFVGFLPKKKGHQTLMRKLREGLEGGVFDGIVLYESPERIRSLLQELLEWGMPLRACLGRELTKQFEEVLRGPLLAVHSELEKRPSIKGEIVLLICPS